MTRSTKSKGHLKNSAHASGEKPFPAKVAKVAKVAKKKKNKSPPKSSNPSQSPTTQRPKSDVTNIHAAANAAANPSKKESLTKAPPKKKSPNTKKASSKKASPKKATPKPSKSSVKKNQAAGASTAKATKKVSSSKVVRKTTGGVAAPAKMPKKTKKGALPTKAKPFSWKSQQPQLPPTNQASNWGQVPWLGGEIGSNSVNRRSGDNSSLPSPLNYAKQLGRSIALGGFPTDGIDPRVMQQLDHELRQLERFVRLTPDEVAARHHVTRCIQETAAQRLPNAQVKAFGYVCGGTILSSREETHSCLGLVLYCRSSPTAPL